LVGRHSGQDAFVLRDQLTRGDVAAANGTCAGRTMMAGVEGSEKPQPETSPAWARFYNEVGSRFAISVAPRIRELYERTETGRIARRTLTHVLDVTRGTWGRVAWLC
jgi:hypothetical protein